MESTAAGAHAAMNSFITEPDEIPRIFHLIWLSGEEKPAQVQRCIESWKSTNPTFRVQEWSLSDVDWRTPKFCEQAVLAKKWAFATDVLRLKILQEHGGVYLDSDVLVHADISHLLACEGFIPWEDDRNLGAHVIGARRGADIVSTWLAAYELRTFVIGNDLVDVTPMPQIITKVARTKFGLNRLGAPQTLANGFRILGAPVGTSKIDDTCIFEHLYDGGWLADKLDDFKTSFAERNRRIKRRYRVRHRLYHWMPSLEPILGLTKRRREQRSLERSRQKNLWWSRKAPPDVATAEPPEFWHVRSLLPAFPRPSAHFGKPFISIIVPAYNVADYIARTLKSVMSQTYGHIEILVIDDGSTDRTPDICAAAAAADPRIQLYRKANGGLGSARNFGLDRAQGDYISFVDGDDWVTDTFIEKFLSSASPTTDIVVCDHAMALPDGRRVGDFRCAWETSERDGIKHLLLTDVECYAWNKLYRRECFTRPDFRFSSGLFEDLAVIPALVGASYSISFTREIDYIYVQRPTSILASVRHNAEKQFAIFEPFDKLVEKQPFFRPDLWAIYYEHKLAKHLFLYRKDALLAVRDADLRHQYIKEFGREIAKRMPHWYETTAVESYIREARSYRRRKKREAIVRQFVDV